MIEIQKPCVLVTRPAPAGPELCSYINQNGGRGLYWPTLEILPPTDLLAFEAGISKLRTMDWWMFISPQAVLMSAEKILSHPIPPHVQIAAQGKGTALALMSLGLTVAALPLERTDSEGLLQLSIFKNPAGLKIAILRGEGGRELVGRTLRTRGAEVHEILAYRRDKPAVDVSSILEEMQQNPLDAIVCSSFEGVTNLKAMLGPPGWNFIQTVPLIVMSERVKQLSLQLGFKNILVVPTGSFKDVMDVILERGNKNVH